jgi:hypothetical protein
MGFPFGFSMVGVTVQLGGPQLAAMGNDPPAAVIHQHDEDGIAVVGKSLDPIAFAPVGPAEPTPKDMMP